MRLSRGARLGNEDAALTRARERLGRPAGRGRSRSSSSTWTAPFTVPVPEGGAAPAPGRARPRSRSRASAGSCAAASAAGRDQMIGVLDYPSGRVAWNIRPLPAAAA